MPVRPVLRPVTSGILTNITGIRGLYDPLVFHALTHAGASGGVDAAGNTLLPYEGTDTLVATVAGLTEARTSTNYAPDHEGVWRSWGSGEAVREGWRIVENVVLDLQTLTANNLNASNDLTGAAGANVSVSFSGGISTVTTTAASGTYIRPFKNASGNTDYFTTGDSYVMSAYVRGVGDSIGKTIALAGSSASEGLPAATTTLSGDWKRLVHIRSAKVDATVEYMSFGLSGLGDGESVEIKDIQIEETTTRSSSLPSEYVAVSTQGTTAKKYFASTNPWEVTSNVATPTATVTELTDIWTKGEPAHTNSLPYSKPDTTNWSLTEGSAGDLVTNGTFDTDTDWTKGTGWSIAAGVASCDGTQGGYSAITQSLSGTLEAGKQYAVTITVSNRTAGTVFIRLAGDDSGTISSNVTVTRYLTPTSSGSVQIYADPAFIGDIDNVIVQPAVIESYTTGLDGAADSAVVLHDDDGSVGEYIEEQVAISATTETNVARVFVKKDNDETRFVGIDLDQTGGTRTYIFLQINTKTGAAATTFTSGTVDYEVRDTGYGWWEVLLSIVSINNTLAKARVFPAGGAVLGTGSTAATGSVTIADPVELHLNTTIAAVRGSSPIMTDGSAASTVASAMSFSDQNHSDDQGGYFAEISLRRIASAGFITLGSTGRILGLLPEAGSRLQTYDGTSSATVDSVITIDITHKIGVAYGSGYKKNNASGTWSAEASYDGAFNNTYNKIHLFGDVTGYQPGQQAAVYIRNIKRWDADYTTAQSLIDTEMSA